MSWSTYKVTSFLDFEPYLQYFSHVEDYLSKFVKHIENFIEDPVFRQFKWGSPVVRSGDGGDKVWRAPKVRDRNVVVSGP